MENSEKLTNQVRVDKMRRTNVEELYLDRIVYRLRRRQKCGKKMR